MNNTIDWLKICEHITLISGEEQVFQDASPTTSGDISQAFLLNTSSRNYFVKIQDRGFLPAYKCEDYALKQLAAFSVKSYGAGETDTHAFLVLEFKHILSVGDERLLAELVAKMHQTNCSDEGYGWDHDNFIGHTLQKNRRHSSWSEFWWENRLAPQLDLAYQNGHHNTLSRHEKTLKAAVSYLLDHHTPSACLLHGDLWSGNKGYTSTGAPIIFDPAPYFGDPETDIAMTKLFGGFGKTFYKRYYELIPRLDGCEIRFRLYNLYHHLNHLHMFGDQYLSCCIQDIDAIIRPS